MDVLRGIANPCRAQRGSTTYRFQGLNYDFLSFGRQSGGPISGLKDSIMGPRIRLRIPSVPANCQTYSIRNSMRIHFPTGAQRGHQPMVVYDQRLIESMESRIPTEAVPRIDVNFFRTQSEQSARRFGNGHTAFSMQLSVRPLIGPAGTTSGSRPAKRPEGLSDSCRYDFGC